MPGATEAEKIQYVLDRGGRFEDYGKAYKGDHTNHAYKKICLIYNEKLATTKNSMTGEYFDGLPYYEPIRDSLGRPVVRDEQKYPFRLNTYHPAYHAQARTAACPLAHGDHPGGMGPDQRRRRRQAGHQAPGPGGRLLPG